MTDPSPKATPLLIVGAGGFGRETAAAVHAVNAIHPRWELLGFLDDDPALMGSEFEGATVLGSVDAGIAAHPFACVVVCAGRPADHTRRYMIVQRLRLPADRFATIVHPAASIAATVAIGHGSVVLAGTVATAQCRIGEHVAIMPGVTVPHDVQISDFATLASGVRLGGGVRIELGAYLGAGALVREHLSIGSWSLVGMGAVVTRSIPPAETWIGIPARRHATIELPAGINN